MAKKVVNPKVNKKAWWVGGWMDIKTVLKIAYGDQK